MVEHRSLDEIWGHEPALIAEEPDFDPNRDRGDIAPRAQGRVDPLAFLVGPVEAVYESDSAKTKVVDLSRFVDHQKKVVRSITGELMWDYGQGLCTLNAPSRPGCHRPLERGRSDPVGRRHDQLEKLVRDGGRDLSGRRAAGACTARALVQIGTRTRPSGWADHTVTFKVNDGKQTVNGRQIDDTGKMPWIIDATRLSITARNSSLAAATLLDINGNAAARIPVGKVDNALEVDFPPNAFYVVLSAK